MISDFFRENGVFNDIKSNFSVAAIVPAYNEEEKLGDVLKALTKTKILSEIIVVDDCSTDKTQDIIKKFNVTYIRNKKNKGKAASMNIGVKRSNSDIIFFCDADLTGLTPKIVEQIVLPVAKGECDMFIGIRNNIMQKSFLPFALNSGERALRRDIWDRLPNYYKHRYRVEVGLNYLIKRLGGKTKYKIFNYYQTLKERKYGIIKGTFLRWWMNMDVSMAFLRMQTLDRQKAFN